MPLLQAVQGLRKGVPLKLIGKHAVPVDDPRQVFYAIDTDVSYVMPWNTTTILVFTYMLDRRSEFVLPHIVT